MKRIFLVVAFFTCFGVVNAQYLNRQPIGTVNTENYTVGSYGTSAGFRFINQFPDSASANAYSVNIKAIPNFLIIINDTLYKRNFSATKWVKIGGSTATGSVTSVGLSLPSIFTVLGSPVTTTGTLTGTLNTQNANLVFAGPTTGAAATPTFRSLVTGDIPSLSSSYWSLTGNAGTNPSTNFLGTQDAQDFIVKTNNLERLRVFSGGNISIPSFLSGSSTDSVSVWTSATGILKKRNMNEFSLPKSINGYISKLFTFGDSFTAGYGLSNTTDAYPYRLANTFGLTLNNQGVSSTAWLGAIWRYMETYPTNNDSSLITFLDGYNNWRGPDLDNPGLAEKTSACVRAILAAAYSNEHYAAKNTAGYSGLTRTGTWADSYQSVNFPTNFASFARQGLGDIGISTTVTNSAISYTTAAASTSVVMGYCRVNGSTGAFTVTLDGRLVYTGVTQGIDAQAETILGGQIGTIVQDALVFNGLKDTIHTMVITFTGGDGLQVDWVGTLKSTTSPTNNTIIIGTIPNELASQHAVDFSSESEFRYGDNAIVAGVYPFLGFPVRIANTNKYWTPTKVAGQLQTDSIHPSVSGNQALLTSFSNQILGLENTYDYTTRREGTQDVQLAVNANNDGQGYNIIWDDLALFQVNGVIKIQDNSIQLARTTLGFPEIIMQTPTAATDEGKWDFYADDSSFNFRALNDLGTVTQSWIHGERTGSNVTRAAIGTNNGAQSLDISTSSIKMIGLGNLSTQNRLIGQYGTSNDLGYVTMGSGLSLSSGVLSATGTGGTVTSVSGTTNQISVATGTTTPVISLASGGTLPGNWVLNSSTATTQTAGDNSTKVATTAYVNSAVTAIGSGTLNYLPKWTPNGTTLGNSVIQDNGSLVTVANPVTISSSVAGDFSTIVENSSSNSSAYSQFRLKNDAPSYFTIKKYSSTTASLAYEGANQGAIIQNDADLNLVVSSATKRIKFWVNNATHAWSFDGNGNFITGLDNSYDIGASGVTRPRDLFLGRNATVGGTLGVTGAVTLSNLTAGRIPYVSTAGLLVDNTNLAWNETNKVLALGGVTPSTWTAQAGAIEGGGGTIFFSVVGDVWTTGNGYFNGGWKYKATNPASNIGIVGGEVWNRVAQSGTINTAITWTMPFKSTYISGGVVGLGGDISTTANSTTGATMVVSPTTVTVDKPIILKAYTVATLPAGTVGMIAYVSDATAPTYGATLVGGGAVKTIAFYDGSAWTAH